MDVALSDLSYFNQLRETQLPLPNSIVLAPGSDGATTILARCLVRLREIEAAAGVEIKRVEEHGSSERCRIAEAERTNRARFDHDISRRAVDACTVTNLAQISAARDVACHAVNVRLGYEDDVCRSRGWLTYLARPSSVITLLVAAACARSIARAARSGRRLVSTCLRACPFFMVYLVLKLCPSTSAAVRGVFGQLFTGSFRVLFNLVRRHGCLDSGKKHVSRDSQQPEQKLANENTRGEPHDASGSAFASEYMDAEMLSRLKAWGLSEYADGLRKQQINMNLLCAMNVEEREILLSDLGCGLGHQVRFRLLCEEVTRSSPFTGDPLSERTIHASRPQYGRHEIGQELRHCS